MASAKHLQAKACRTCNFHAAKRSAPDYESHFTLTRQAVPMPVIKILPHAEYCPQGAEISAPAGTSICEALLDNHINIEHACDMSRACTTCHVVVRDGFQSLNELEEEEEDLLDRAWGLEPQSRLSCQAILAQKDVTIEIPKYSLNHAKENH